MKLREILEELVGDTTKALYEGSPDQEDMWGIEKALQALKALHTIDWEDIVKAMDCLGYHGLGTKLTSKEIEKMATSITKYINTREQ